MRTFRRSRWLAYVMSLCVLGSAAWFPATIMAQVLPGSPFEGGGGGGGATYPVSDEVFKVADNGDPTKLVEFENAGITTGNTVVATWGGTAAAPSFTLTDGIVRAGASTTAAPAFSFSNDTDTGLIRNAAVGGVSVIVDTTERTHFDGSGVLLENVARYGWTASNVAQPVDTELARVSAGVIRMGDATANSIRFLAGGGATVASAAALPLPTGRVFHVSGTTNVTSITSTNFESGAVITLIFDGVLTFTDGNNIAIAGNFVTTASDTITLVYDGTNWYEIARAVN